MPPKSTKKSASKAARAKSQTEETKEKSQTPPPLDMDSAAEQKDNAEDEKPSTTPTKRDGAEDASQTAASEAEAKRRASPIRGRGGKGTAGKKRKERSPSQQQGKASAEREPTPLFEGTPAQEEEEKNDTNETEEAEVSGRPSEIVRNAVQKSIAARKKKETEVLSGATSSGRKSGRASAKFATPSGGSRPSGRVVRSPTPETKILTPIRGTLSVVGDAAAGETKIELEPFVTGGAAMPAAGWKGMFHSLPMRGVDGSGKARALSAMVSFMLPPNVARIVETEQHDHYED